MPHQYFTIVDTRAKSSHVLSKDVYAMNTQGMVVVNASLDFI